MMAVMWNVTPLTSASTVLSARVSILKNISSYLHFVPPLGLQLEYNCAARLLLPIVLQVSLEAIIAVFNLLCELVLGPYKLAFSFAQVTIEMN